jgi:hypothetical protein
MSNPSRHCANQGVRFPRQEPIGACLVIDVAVQPGEREQRPIAQAEPVLDLSPLFS